jgi:hypothetical protein
MLPASLEPNFREELQKCGDPIYAVENHWTTRTLTEEVRAEGKRLGISDKFMDKHNQIFITTPSQTPNFESFSVQDKKAIREQIKDVLEQRFNFIRYNGLSTSNIDEYIKDGMYDDSVVIVDEAHNVRESPTVSADKVDKKIPEALKEVVKVANGMTLVLLTATPMYDTYEEIVFLFNLFLWNDKRQSPDEQLTPEDFFKDDGFKSPEAEARFRGYAHEYVSFIRGENPFTFPFRLPPPPSMIAPRDRTKDNRGKDFETPPLKYLDLVASYLESPQRESVEEIRKSIQESMFPCIVASPDGRPVSKCFDAAQDTSQATLRYRADVIPFLGHGVNEEVVDTVLQRLTGYVPQRRWQEAMRSAP